LSTSITIEPPILGKPSANVVIVHEVEKDYESIKNFVNKNMLKAFSRLFFLKPKSNEIECESISLVYECFAIINSKYHLEYYRNNRYMLNVDDKVTESIVHGHNLKPKKTKDKSGSKKQIEIECKERVLYKNQKQHAFDRKGRPVNPKKIPSARTKPEPIEFLQSYVTNVRHLEVSIPEILKKSIKNRPEDIEEIIDEHLEISSHVLIYTPIFEARCKNLKTNEIKIIPVSGVTGKIFGL
jgi:hypothetical protein